MLVQALTVCLLGLAYGSPAYDHPDMVRLSRSVEQVQSYVMHGSHRLPQVPRNTRVRRQSSLSTDMLDETTMCILRCTARMNDAIEPFKLDQTTQSYADKMMKPSVNMSRFVDMCTALRPSLTCFESCPESELKSTMRTTIDPIQFICVYRFEDFKSNFRCMQKLQTDSVSQCQPRCRRYEASVNKTMQLSQRPYMRYFYTANEIRQMLGGTCDYVQCLTECTSGLARTVCGQTASELIKLTTQKVFGTIQAAYQVRNVQDMFPESCRRLARPEQDQEEVVPPQEIDQDEDEQDDQEESIYSQRGYRNRNVEGQSIDRF